MKHPAAPLGAYRSNRPVGARMRVLWMVGVGGLILTALPLRAQDAEWVSVGSMSGAPTDSFEDFLDNELFQEARTGELFQELGDLEFSQSFSRDLVTADLRAKFERRLVDRQRILPPESLVGQGDLSGYEAINSAIAKGTVTADYVDIPGPAAVRFEAEAGYSLTVAEARAGRADEPENGAAAERRLADLEASLPRRIVNKVGRGLVQTVDRLASGVGSRFEDTEKGAVYLEGFAEPLTLWADFGFPLPSKLFSALDTRLKPGDAASHSAFFEIQPVVAGIRGIGMRSSVGTFYRFVRTTTVVKLENDEVLVQVKNLAARGVEAIPLKIRPELHWFLLSYGYTFLEDRHDRARFQISELTYQFDLKSDDGKAAFQALLGETGHVVFRPALDAAAEGRGVRILRARQRGGNRWDLKWRARLPSWFDSRRSDLGVFQTVTTPEGDWRAEASRGRTLDHRRKIFGRRQRRASTLATFATPLAPGARDLERAEEAAAAAPEGDSQPVLRLETAVRDRYASRGKRRDLLDLVAEVAPDATPETLRRLVNRGPEVEGVSVSARLEFGRQTVPAVLALSEDRIWQVVAGRLLGERHRDVWNQASRPLWRNPRPALDSRGHAVGLHISEQVDRELLREDPHRREAWPNSRSLFTRADQFVRAFEGLRGELARGEIGRWPVWLPSVDPPADFALLAGVFLEALGTFDRPGVSARAEVWLESMLRPAVWRSGVNQLPVAPVTSELPPSLDANAAVQPPAVVDASPTELWTSPTWTASADERGLIPDVSHLRSSPPRLAAGRVLVHLPSWPAEVRLRLELFSDFRFTPTARLQAELRRSRIRTDVTEDRAFLALPEPERVPDGPFMVARYRYEIDLPFHIEEPDEARTLYLRMENADGQPISEEQPLRFRVSAVEKAAKDSK